jgi:hypothetical protein
VDLIEELLGVLEALDAERIDYAVCGGIAVAIHGYPRFTKDIDLLVQSADLERIRDMARRRGFTLAGGPLLFGAGTGNEREVVRLTKTEGTESLTLVMLLAGAALSDAWRTRIRVQWRGRDVHVVSRDGLLQMKRISGRTQDLADIEALTRRPDGGSTRG